MPIPPAVAGQTQLVLVLVTAVTRAVSPVLQPVLGERPSRPLLAVDRYMLPPCLFALWSVGVRFQLEAVLTEQCLSASWVKLPPDPYIGAWVWVFLCVLCFVSYAWSQLFLS
jgi:hypothetical protein